MFEATLAQGEMLKKIIASLSDMIQETNFQCDNNGISLQGMDSSHVSLVSLMLHMQGFSEYRCDRQLTLGLNLNSLSKVLKCLNSKDSLSLRCDEDSDVLDLIFENPSQDRVSNFQLKLMDIDAEQLGIPDQEYNCVVQMPSTEFQRICRDLAAIGDTLSISATKEGVKFSVNGDIGSGNMTLRKGEGNAVDEGEDEQVLIKLDEPVHQSFALRYLNFFTKATALSKTVTLSISPDVPLVVEYSMDDLGYIRYYLAPKIDDDDA